MERFRILLDKQALAPGILVARERLSEFIEAFDEARKKIDDDGNEAEELEEDKMLSEAPPRERPAMGDHGGSARAAWKKWHDAAVTWIEGRQRSQQRLRRESCQH